MADVPYDDKGYIAGCRIDARMIEATKRPWRVGDAGHTVFGPQCGDGNAPAMVAQNVTRANARLIVEAVNAHDELVALVRDYRDGRGILRLTILDDHASALLARLGSE